MYETFELVLMVNHACNLRCSYCYTGSKFQRALSGPAGQQAIDRAAASIHSGGTLELGFFGGEPLLEAEQILGWIARARQATAERGLRLRLHTTTNGTLATGFAWQVLLLPDLQLHISHDGLPAVHDHHRRGPDGRGSSEQVEATLRRLMAVGREVRSTMVVRPETVDQLPAGIAYLRELGVRQIDASLDLWTAWSRDDLARLEQAVTRVADLWYEGLPDFGLTWFDTKLTKLLAVPTNETARCRFGAGQIAVAPSGNLYPCERLIGEDRPENSCRLPGHVLEGEDFCSPQTSEQDLPEACASCAIQAQCSTACRCSNAVRTGDSWRPDGLLCRFDQAVYRETVRILRKMHSPPAQSLARKEVIHV